MFTRTFHPGRFLRCASGSEPFADYCRSRGIPFEQAAPAAVGGEGVGRWVAALSRLPPAAQARVELELAKVYELADREAVDHLIQAAGEGDLPPEHIPGGVPLSLWFFLHRPEHFAAVFLHHEVSEADGWRSARAAPQAAIDDLAATADALAGELKGFFRLTEGGGRFCAVDARRLPDSYCFTAQVADRLQLVEGFSDAGEPTAQRLRPALPVFFVYYPETGDVLLKCHLRAPERTRALLQCFGRAALGGTIERIAEVFDLERLKRPFHPLPDAPDIDEVRVKSLCLRYPEHAGRRKVLLDTLAGDAPEAIDELLSEHLRGSAAEELRVSYAEIQVRLRTEAGRRHSLIRLWPDRCDLDRTPLGERMLSCLKRWGLSYE
jgi:hypothetical protein